MAVVGDVERDRIAALVSDILEIDQDEISEESLFKEHHGADSLRAIEILASLEREFGVQIDQSQLGRMVNLRGIYDVVADVIAAKS